MAEPEQTIYPWFDVVPQHLKTRNQLAEQGLRPGGPVVARVVWRRGERWADLYDMQTAKPKRAATEAQLAALAKAQEKRRTCPLCKAVLPFVLPWRFLPERDCPNCQEQMVEADRADAVRKARRALARSDTLLLDTETTSLDGYVVQIGILALDGTVLLDTLVNPLAPISEEAQRVHGISERDLVDAPTFTELADQISVILQGKRVWAYNAGFDRSILWNELYRLAQARPVQPVEHAAQDDAWSVADGWCAAVRWRCAMRLYATYVGDWSEYRGEYRWWPLPGALHQAIDDCRAVLRLLHDMAADTSYDTAPANKEQSADDTINP